jgi:aspartate/methionine/tyrosine aminotransferase
MTTPESVQRSDYMHWAKTRQAARFNLAVSGVPGLSLHDLPGALDDVELNGASTYGWPPLQQALAQHLQVGPDRIVHAAGTSFANHLAMAVTFRPGDDVLVEHPTYELLLSTAAYLGASIRRLRRRPEDRFQIDPAAVRAALTPRTRLIVLTNLHNPSSVRIPDSTLLEIAQLAAAQGAYVLVDEVYLDAASEPPPATSHRLHDHILVTSSLTKVYGLSGLRCGWVIANPTLTERMWRLNDLFGVIPAHPAERMSVTALRQLPTLRARARHILDTNRDAWNTFLASRDDLEGWPIEFGNVAFPRLKRGNVDSLCSLLREKYETTVVPRPFLRNAGSFPGGNLRPHRSLRRRIATAGSGSGGACTLTKLHPRRVCRTADSTGFSAITAPIRLHELRPSTVSTTLQTRSEARR